MRFQWEVYFRIAVGSLSALAIFTANALAQEATIEAPDFFGPAAESRVVPNPPALVQKIIDPTPTVPDQCSYFQEVMCDVTKAKVLSIDFWSTSLVPERPGSKDLARVCKIVKTVQRVPDRIMCYTVLGDFCISSLEAERLARPACENDPMCSLVHQAEDIVTRTLVYDEESFKALCEGEFQERKKSIGQLEDDRYTFPLAPKIISAAQLQCKRKCGGEATEMTCPEGIKPTVSDAAICKAKVSKTSAKKGWKQFTEYYFPTDPDRSFAVCRYHKDCTDFKLNLNISTISDSEFNICQPFGDALLGHDFSEYEGYCGRMESMLKADPQTLRRSKNVGYYTFRTRGQSDNFRWLWNWDTYRNWAKSNCDAINEDVLEQNAVVECADQIYDMEASLIAAKEIPTITRACCKLPLK